MNLDVLYEASSGTALPLPAALRMSYGETRFPGRADAPYVIANFVSTLDGVVSLGPGPNNGGAAISGGNPGDRMVMGLLRAIADFVLIGAGAVRTFPDHLWTPECIFPELGDSYRELRSSLGKPAQPTTVIVTGNGQLPREARIFSDLATAPLILTNEDGGRVLKDQTARSRIAVLKSHGPLTPAEILSAIGAQPGARVLVEAGPRLTAEFLAAGHVAELFLTLSPQVAGRDTGSFRPGFVDGRLFAPGHEVWGNLISLRRGGDHLFLRYSFPTTKHGAS